MISLGVELVVMRQRLVIARPAIAKMSMFIGPKRCASNRGKMRPNIELELSIATI
jgi:hypothetical protein